MAFIFDMSIPCDTTFLLVTSSRSSVQVKVKYQGPSFRKNGRCKGIRVSQTHLVKYINVKLLTLNRVVQCNLLMHFSVQFCHMPTEVLGFTKNRELEGIQLNFCNRLLYTRNFTSLLAV